MKENSAITILKNLTEEEVRLFEAFINSPFHNKNEKVVRLFNELKTYHPDYHNLDKKVLFRKVFGNAQYKDFHIRNLFSDLNLIAEDFLVYVHLNNDHIYEKLLIEELIKRNILDLSGKKIKSLEKKLKLSKSKDQVYYNDKVFIYESKSYLTVDKTLTDDFRKDQMLAIIKSFLITITEFSFYLIIEEQRVKISHNFDFIRLLIGYIKNNINDFNDSPILMIYYYLCLCLLEEEDNEKNFSKARSMFRKEQESLSIVDKKNIYSMFQTYCINKVNAGHESYNKELLNVLLEMMKLNVFSHVGKRVMNLNLVRNIVIMAVNLKEKNLLNKFLKEYIAIVAPESRESISAYANAHLSFLQGNYQKALILCNEINFNDLLVTTNENLYFKLDIKKLVLLCLIELGLLDNAISYVDAFRHFLNNSKLVKEDLRNRYLKFLKYANDLIKLILKFDEFNFLKFKNKIIVSDNLTGRSWLIGKTDWLEKRESLRKHDGSDSK